MKFSTADTPQLQISHRSGHLLHYLLKKKKKKKISKSRWPSYHRTCIDHHSTAVSVTHTISYDVFMKIPLFYSLIRNLSDCFPPPAPQRKLLLAGIHHMKMHNAAKPHAPINRRSLLFCHREKTSPECCSNYCR